jgi:hypothetical protein
MAAARRGTPRPFCIRIALHVQVRVELQHESHRVPVDDQSGVISTGPIIDVPWLTRAVTGDPNRCRCPFTGAS